MNRTSADFHSNMPVIGNDCTSFTYSDWGACQYNSTQTRSVLTSSPVNCTGGSPVISQFCIPTLTVDITPQEGGNVTGSNDIECGVNTCSPCQYPIANSTQVTLYPNPNDNWAFDHWNIGTGQSNDNPLSVTMAGDKGADAVFVPDPNFLLPLPGGKHWVLSVEAGGQVQCNGGTDQYHTASSYYALDFVDYTSEDGDLANTDVSILAAASGVIDSYGYDTDGYGNWVMIDHQNGYKTRYAHMVSQSLVTSGPVTQGQQIGVMGSTGDSTSTHLHFQFYYNGNSSSTNTALQSINLDGHTVSYYQVSTSNDCNAAAYLSTNQQ